MIKIFDIVFENKDLDRQYKELGFKPGVHPVVTTHNKLLDGIRKQVTSVLKGENKYLPNYGSKLTKEELLQLVTKGSVVIHDKNGEPHDVSIAQALDKPGMLIEILKELIVSGFYTREETSPAMKYLLALSARLKMTNLKKENYFELSNIEIENLLFLL